MISRLGLAGSALAFATAGVYLALILSEGNDSPAEFVPWAATFGGIGIAAVLGSMLARGPIKAALFAGAGGTALALGLVALMSIGALLLGVAALLIGAANESWRDAGAGVGRTLAASGAAAAIALAVLISIL
ncbi:MAG: hypothetical protein ICV67_02280 [Thermoleophilia bacterium]|nr:hypothetical protein [Thermoleophilia bacterium]